MVETVVGALMRDAALDPKDKLGPVVPGEMRDEGETEIPLDPETERRAIQTVLKSRDEADEDRKVRANDWVKYYKFYRGKYDFEDDFPFSNRMVPPIAYSVVETVTPRLMNGMFGSRKFLEVLPRDDDADIAQSKRVRDLLLYQCHDEIDIVPRFTPWLKSAAIYGTAICQIGWEERTETVIKRKSGMADGAGPEPVPGYVEEKVEVKISRPTLEPLVIYDFWIDPHVVGSDAIERAKYCIRKENVRPSELARRMNEPSTGYFTRPETLKPAEGASSEDTQYRDDERIGLGLPALFGESQQSPVSQSVELLHYWGEFQETEGGEWKEWCIVIADRKRLVKFVENPFGGHKPFIHVAPTPDSTEFYGIGEIECIEDLLEAYICWFNQTYDNVALMLSPQWLMRADALLDLDEILRPRPGGVVRVDEKFGAGIPLDQIAKPIVHPDLRSSGWRIQDTIKEQMDRANGQFDYTRGDKSDTANATATGIAAIIGEANARFQSKIAICQYQFIKKLGSWLLRLNARYMPPEKAVRILGDEEGYKFVTVGIDDLFPEYDISAIGAPLLGNKTMLRDALTMFVDQISQNPALGRFVPDESWRTLLEQMADLVDQDLKIKTVETVMQEAQMAQQQEMAMIEMGKLAGIRDALQMKQLEQEGVTPEDVEKAMSFYARGNEAGGQPAPVPQQG